MVDGSVYKQGLLFLDSRNVMYVSGVRLIAPEVVDRWLWFLFGHRLLFYYLNHQSSVCYVLTVQESLVAVVSDRLGD